MYIPSDPLVANRPAQQLPVSVSFPTYSDVERSATKLIKAGNYTGRHLKYEAALNH